MSDIVYTIKRNILNLMPDKMYLKLKFRKKFGKKLNLKNPKTYNEKLQWLKLYDRNPMYTKMADKYEARNYIEETIGKEYLIPLLGVYDNFDEIDFDNLPNSFVIKTTHDSGGVIICKDKSKLDIINTKKRINKLLKRNYFYYGREWPYKNIKPRIIIEKFIEDENGKEIKDYKWFCFNGEPKIILVATDRNNPKEETKTDFYDMNFKHLNFTCNYPNSKEKIEKPQGFEKMKKIAEKLSKDIPHIRIDFYNVNEKIYFGEFTFYHFSGMAKIKPEEWNYKLGEWIELPINNK